MTSLTSVPAVELLGHPAARLLTLALLHFLWQGVAIAVLLVVSVELLGIRRTSTRYACSLAALLLMLACPLVTVAWLSTGQPQSVGWAVPTTTSTITDSVVGTAHPTWLTPLQPLALAAWLTGVSLFGGRLLVGAIGLSWLRGSRQALPLDLASLVERLGQRMKIEALPLVFISQRVTEAMAVGLFRPLVLIPAAWVTEMPLPLLEAVIAHELAHLRRRDLWINLLQRVAETLLFYHPAIWWLSRRLRTERELCADELAVAATGRRLEYAQALEQVAHRRQAEVRPAPAAFMRGESNMRVLERVRNVLGLAGGERSRLWPAGIVALALPAALWAAAIGLRSATADEPKDGDKPAVKRDGDKPAEKDGERKVEAKFFGKDGEKRDEPRRDGDVKKDAPRDGAVKKEGARDGEVKKDVARDGEPRKVVARDGEPKKEPARDGEARRDVIERKIVARDADRPAGEAGRIDELTNLVKRLSAQVERLQAEVTALRGGKEGVKEGSRVEVRDYGSEKEAVIRRIKEAEAYKDAAAAKREAAERDAIRSREPGKKPAAEGARREGDKPAAEGARREGGDKPRADGERREGGDKPAAEGARREEVRKIEVIKERAVADKEAVARERELIEKKKAAAAAAGERKEEKKEEKKEDK